MFKKENWGYKLGHKLFVTAYHDITFLKAYHDIKERHKSEIDEN